MAWPKFLRGLFGSPPPPPIEVPAPVVLPPLPVPDEAPNLPATTTDMRDPALEAAIVASPDDHAALLVYADWLTERGDVRGELIAMSIDGSIEAERRIAQLARKFREHLYGFDTRAADEASRAGYLRHIAYDDEPDLDRLRATLVHPFGMLVDTIAAPVAWHAGIAALVGDRPIAIVERDSTTPCARLDGNVVIDTTMSAMFDVAPWMRDGAHAFIARTTVRCADGTTHAWSYGSSDGLSEEAFEQDPPYTGRYTVAARGVATITCELRIAIADTEVVRADYRGTLALTSLDRYTSIHLARLATPLAGPPFDPTPVTAIAPATAGPTLSRRTIRNGIDDPRLAALPDRGVFDPDIARILLATGGELPITGATPHEDSYPCFTSGAPDGKTIAIAHRGTARAEMAGWLTTITFAASGKPKVRHLSVGTTPAMAVALAGERVVLIAQDAVTLVDAATGKAKWRAPYDVIPTTPNVVVTADEVVVIAYSSVQHFALADGARRTAHALPIVRYDVENAYGFAPPLFDPPRDRTIELQCIADGYADLGARTIIAWRDGDGPRTEVCVADDGHPSGGDDEFGTLGVLPDGRILAIGTQIWLVDPTARTVASLGPAASYQRPLLVTRAPGDRYRLYNRGMGPWFIEFA